LLSSASPYLSAVFGAAGAASFWKRGSFLERIEHWISHLAVSRRFDFIFFRE
jgi:hypothetical protein